MNAANQPGPRAFLSREDEIKAALERIRAYLESGRKKELQSALDKEALSARTISNWLAKPEKAKDGYKAQSLVRLLEHLPPLNDTRFEAYKFALSELDVSIHSQRDVQKYHGNYSLMHRFSGLHTKDIKHLRIDTRIMRGLNVFGLRYRVHEHATKCDGFVFIRANRLYLFGLSSTTSFFSIFKTVSDPKKSLMLGMSMIEDLTDEEVWFSTSCLCNAELQLSNDHLALAERHLSGGQSCL